MGKEQESSRSKMLSLKQKVKEYKKLRKINKNTKNVQKSELKLIKKANRIPQGERIINNKQGKILEVFNVSKIYVSGKTQFKALDNVSFDIKKGELVVILGESGSGKTTLLNVISGLDRATSGDIVIKNTNLSALRSSELTTFRRNHIGFVFQSYNLLMELNALDNAKLGQKLQTNAHKRLDLNVLFKRLGLEAKEKKTIDELSGGQSQRVSIIRALAKNPALIFADEPTGALDTKTSGKVIELFKEINRKYGTTIILVTHDKSITKIADKIIYVTDGKVKVETQ